MRIPEDIRTKHPVKVLFCIDRLARGGTELQLINLIDRLDRTGIEPHLFTLKSYDTESFQTDCPHLATTVPRVFSVHGLESVVSLARWLRKNHFDVVQTFFQDATIIGGLAAMLAKVPVRIGCFRDMGFWRTGKSENVLKFTYRSLTHYLANSATVRDHFVQDFGLSPNKFDVIYNGIDTEALPWVEHDGPVHHVAIVGNLNRRVKRTDLFIKAAGILSPEFPHITWHILGEGMLLQELENLAAELGLSDRVVFAGSVNDVPGYLERIQIGVISSDSEGLSNALMEYQLKGCATVATAVGGNSEIVRHMETGLLVPPDNAEAMAAALRDLVQKEGLRRSVARQARLHAENSYSWSKCLSAHETIYRSRK